MLNKLRSFIRDEKGEDLIEYGLLAAFVAAVAIALLGASSPLRTAIGDAFNRAVDALNKMV